MSLVFSDAHPVMGINDGDESAMPGPMGDGGQLVIRGEQKMIAGSIFGIGPIKSKSRPRR